MALLIELPSDVEEELTFQAAQRGISASELVSFLLQFITSPKRDGPKTSISSGSETTSIMSDRTDSRTIDPLDRDRILSLLRNSKGPVTKDSADPVERKPRVSALGKFAHLGLSTEALIAEKRLETAREDRL